MPVPPHKWKVAHDEIVEIDTVPRALIASIRIRRSNLNTFSIITRTSIITTHPFLSQKLTDPILLPMVIASILCFYHVWHICLTMVQEHPELIKATQHLAQTSIVTVGIAELTFCLKKKLIHSCCHLTTFSGQCRKMWPTS